jgi:DNA transformation protein
MAYEELAAHCIELLTPLGAARSKRMFGGQGIWLDDLFIALIADDRIYLKTDAQTRPAFVAAGCEPFVYDRAREKVALGYWSAPAEAVDSPAQMEPWARLAVEAALRARAAKAPAARRKPAAKASAPAATPRRPKTATPRGKPSRRG